MPLSHEQLLSIGKQAANEVIGHVHNVNVVTGTSEKGDPAYFFELRLSQNRDRPRATMLRVRLRQKIRDLLIAQNDGRYPFVTIVDELR